MISVCNACASAFTHARSHSHRMDMDMDMTYKQMHQRRHPFHTTRMPHHCQVDITSEQHRHTDKWNIICKLRLRMRIMV